MITSSLHGNNRLIRKTIVRMFPGNFSAGLTVNIALMVDTLLAGAILGQKAIAAVAIGLPAIGIFQALTQTVISGAAVKLAVYAGKSEQEKMNRIYSLGMAGTVILGLIFMAICLFFADFLTRIFGGAANPAVAAQAALYLRAASVCILAGSLNTFLSKILSLYGYPQMVFRSALVAMLGNIVFSLLYMKLLPDHLAIAGLGMGTWTGGLMAILLALLATKQKKIPMKFRLKDVDLKALPEIVRLGISTSGNNLADNAVSAVINNIIVMGFGGDTSALSVYTAVKGVFTFAITPIMSTTSSAANLFGILYGARDKNGILRTVHEGYKVGIVSSAIWCAALIGALPLLGRLYGMNGNPHFQSGVLVCMLFIPLWMLVRLLIQLFESTEKIGMGILYSIVPDSVIYPIMLALLLPIFKYNGIWIAYAANAIPFLIILYLLRSLKAKTLLVNPDRLCCLEESIRDNVPMLDISVLSNNTDVTGISGQVHSFLEKEGASERTAYMTALCLEELAADFVAHTEQSGKKTSNQTIMDIKLFSDEDRLRIIMRNAAPAYNPLEFDLDDATFAKAGVKLVQKVCRYINYNYVYKMNIITIDIDKA